mmetsp:Transcript_54032/g.135861  ORF Transcript_54032/g.135861 Transcript_54032/m.135861 type:complete len:502 (+) Transcript_54032:144-1649(+)
MSDVTTSPDTRRWAITVTRSQQDHTIYMHTPAEPTCLSQSVCEPTYLLASAHPPGIASAVGLCDDAVERLLAPQDLDGRRAAARQIAALVQEKGDGKLVRQTAVHFLVRCIAPLLSLSVDAVVPLATLILIRLKIHHRHLVVWQEEQHERRLEVDCIGGVHHAHIRQLRLAHRCCCVVLLVIACLVLRWIFLLLAAHPQALAHATALPPTFEVVEYVGVFEEDRTHRRVLGVHTLRQHPAWCADDLHVSVVEFCGQVGPRQPGHVGGVVEHRGRHVGEANVLIHRLLQLQEAVGRHRILLGVLVCVVFGQFQGVELAETQRIIRKGLQEVSAEDNTPGQPSLVRPSFSLRRPTGAHAASALPHPRAVGFIPLANLPRLVLIVPLSLVRVAVLAGQRVEGLPHGCQVLWWAVLVVVGWGLGEGGVKLGDELEGVVALLVVYAAADGVQQDLVCRGKTLEAECVPTLVGVTSDGLATVRLFDVFLCGVATDAELVIELVGLPE